MTDLATALVEAILGSLFVAIGLAAAIAGLSARPRRDMSAFWMGIFCLLYGTRLLSKSALIQAVIPGPESPFDYVEVFITYTILIPAGLFVETLVGPGRYHLVRRVWQANAVLAAAAIVNDLARAQPAASMAINPPIVLLTLLVHLGHVLARMRAAQWTTDLRAVAATGAILTAVAISETLSDRGLLGTALDVEPIAMLLFICVVGWSVLARAREQAFGFAALSRELQLARTIQQSLFPKQMPAAPGLRIQGAYLPMSAVAGDFYDVAPLADGRIALIVADVSGHGVPAALVASMVKIAFAAEAERFQRPGEILAGINRALTGKFEHAYVTASCVVVDRARQAIAYAAAGHPPALLRRRDGRVERLEEGGIVLTLLPAAAYDTLQVAFDVGDRLLLFTDGLLEAARAGDGQEFFGDAELARLVAALPPTVDASQVLLDAHRAWIGRRTPLSDDVTLVVVECVSA